jgi:hypothetical protein
VTGWPVSARRGDQGEFATLQPPDGYGPLKVQVVGEVRAGGPRFACAGTIPYEEPRLDDVEAVVAVAALHNPARNGILLRHTTNSEVVRS